MVAPSERILAAFAGIPLDAREILAEALERQHTPFLASLGSSLTYSPKLAAMVLTCALKRVNWDGSAVLIDRLSNTSDPWKTVRTVLIGAIGTDGLAATTSRNTQNNRKKAPS